MNWCISASLYLPLQMSRAMEVAAGIVGELYEKTGDFHLERLIPEVEACWS
jgi:hypothetical protein